MPKNLPDYSHFTLDYQESLITAFEMMDKVGMKLLLIAKDQNFYSMLSVGDIQRGIIGGVGLNEPVYKVVRPKEQLLIGKVGDDSESLYELMLKSRCEYMPILDIDGRLRDIIFWSDVFPETDPKEQVQIPVVVMAGGKSTRLKPFSNIIPKPLFPIGDKTILEQIIHSFQNTGSTQFFLLLNYKHKMVLEYLKETSIKGVEIKSLVESDYYGTAGSLALLRKDVSETFIVTNCDVLIDVDVVALLEFHKKSDNILTIVSAVHHDQLPYGVIESDGRGGFMSLSEKPSNNFMINIGLYVLEPAALEFIEDGSFLHITDLINSLKTKGLGIGVFPISQRSWNDIGEWSEYKKTISALGLESPF